jgi:aminoglycoside 6-adenylyltransferase
MTVKKSYELLEQKLAVWAKSQTAIWAVLVVGSRARSKYPADDWSDLDLMVYVEDKHALIDDSSWMNEFGEVWISFLNNTADGYPEWMVLYSGGLKIDFLMTPAPSVKVPLQTIIETSPHRAVYELGVRAIYLRDGQIPHLTPPARITGISHPTQSELENALSRYLIIAVRGAMLLNRGDMWRATDLCNSDMRRQTINMMEWHVRSIHGKNYDTWVAGRFFTQWADPRAVRALSKTYPHFENHDVWRALLGMLELYRWLVAETACRLGYTFSLDKYNQVYSWIRSIAPPKLD